MMGWLGKLLSYGLGQVAYTFLFSQMRKKALLTYLKTLKLVRQSLLAVVFILISLQIMILGLVGTLVTAVWLYPSDLETKVWILLGLFLTLFIIPGLGLMLFFSERTWLKISGAEKIISESV